MQIPKASCVYNNFDVDTLAPLNHETRARLLELRVDKLDVSGKAILDIGCNNGYLSFICSELGAKSVTATDVQEPLLEYVREIAKQRYPAIDVKKADFKSMDTSAFRSDIVFFLEVLHWVVAQGLPVNRAIEKLASLTREVAVLEFPWSVDEPSIRAQTKLTAKEYSADLIFEELMRNFSEVDVVNFNTYFRGQQGSKRVLVIARAPKRTRFLEPWLPGIGRIEADLSGKKSHILTCDQHNVFCVKTLKENASVLEVPNTLLRKLFLALENLEGIRSAIPIEIDGRFVLKNPQGKPVLVYPWVGSIPIRIKDKASIVADASENIAVALKVIKAFGAIEVSRDERTALSPVSKRLNERITDAHEKAKTFLKDVGVENLAEQRVGDNESSWIPVHGDIHFGNVVMEAAGPILVDFENVSVNTEFFDLLWAIVMSGVTDHSLMEDALERGRDVVGRAVEFRDFVSVYSSFDQWRKVIGAPDLAGKHERTITRVEESLRELARLIGRVVGESM